MTTTLLLAQALPSASSGVDWLYQFTNNLTNLTTQNGGVLTQLGMTELSCVSLFVLVSMVIGWSTSSMTLSFYRHPVRAGDLTEFLLRLIVCCLLENYWVNPFPGASFGINHFFSYIAQAMVAAFDQNSLDTLLQLLRTAGNNTPMPSLMAPLEILCYFIVQILFGPSVGHPVRDQLQCLHPVWCERVVRTNLYPAPYDQNLPGEVLPIYRCAHQLCDDSGCGRGIHLRVGWIYERFCSANI